MKQLNKSVAMVAASAIFLVAYAAQQIDTKNWQTFSSKEGSFKIKTPQGWGVADPEDPATKEALEKIKKNNPKMSAMFENTDKSGYDLYLYDFSGDASQGLSNLNLKTLKDSGLTQAMYPDVAKEIVKGANMTNAGWKVVTMPMGKTLTYWGSLSVALGEGAKMDFKVYGYLVVKGNMCYICTMTTTPQKDKEQKPIFEEMAKSITLK